MSDISKRLAALSPEKRAQLAERLQKEAALQSKQSERTVIPKRATQADGEYQLSSAQKRMWFLHQLNPESPLYNMPLLMLRLRGSLNRTALEQSLQTLEMRHEVLRTTFLSREGTPFQKIGAPGKLTIAFRDLSDRTEEQRERHLLEWAREEANRPFALEQGGLIRVTLIKLQEQEHALFSMMHHIISDGESFGLFVSELSALYNAFATGQASPLPELTVQYADYAAWQLEQLESKEIKAQLDYWKKQLSGPLPVLELPSDRPRASERSYKGEKANAQLPREVTQRLHAWCRQEGVTPFMALLAVFNVLLYRYTGQEDIVVGSAINNRNRTELERVIGFFVNTLVLRTQLTSELSFGALVKQVRDTALDAYAHQEVPLEKLVEELLQDREGQASLFNTMFAYQTLPKSNLSLHALDVESRVMTSETTRFDLLFSLTETENGINALLEY
ncbi:MAG: condensation domain-containing protein, partial [Tumebacillaceae bacterium]